jgi:hypothetical protein
MKQVFEKLNAINVNEHTEKKNNLTYLSWAWAWAEVKKQYPNAQYEIKMFDGKPFLYDENLGYMVMTSMTIEGLTHEMWLPVMDNSNKAMKDHAYTYKVKNPNFKYAKLDEMDGKYYDKYGNVQEEYNEKCVEKATMFDVNTAIMRCLTKNIAMFGLGLYIYAGEDLPQVEQKEDAPQMASKAKIETIKTVCKRNKVSYEKLLASYGRTEETLTEAEATQLIIGLKKKYGDD